MRSLSTTTSFRYDRVSISIRVPQLFIFICKLCFASIVYLLETDKISRRFFHSHIQEHAMNDFNFIEWTNFDLNIAPGRIKIKWTDVAVFFFILHSCFCCSIILIKKTKFQANVVSVNISFGPLKPASRCDGGTNDKTCENVNLERHLSEEPTICLTFSPHWCRWNELISCWPIEW